MRTRVWGGTCLAVIAVSTVTLLGQGTKELVLPTLALTGCIAQSAATAGRAGGGSEPATTSSADRYVLTKAAVAPSTTPPAADQPKPPTATQYRLNGPDSMLAPYVAHQVEVSGRIEEPATRPASGAGANMPTFKVDAVRMMAASCP